MGNQKLERTKLFGFDFVDDASLKSVCSDIGSREKSDRFSAVVTPNVDILVQLEDASPDALETELFGNAEYCLPDGQPIVWASKFLKKPLSGRLAGSDLFASLWPDLCDNAVPVTMVVSSQSVADHLSEENSLAEFIIPPFINVEDSLGLKNLVEDILKVACSNKSEMIFCGLGHPKDARIIHGLLSHWPDDSPPLCFALGASFSFYTGEQKRAPEWMQKAGLEWFFRFASEPRRLFHRYFVRSPRFLRLVWRERFTS